MLRDFNGLADCVRRAARYARTPSHDVRDIAPSTAADTVRAYAERGRLTVWSGGTATAIYADPAANWQFRAWHDFVHVRTGFGFSVADEVALARVQCEQAARIGDLFARIVWLEIAGQALEYARTGAFLTDQRAWTLSQLK